MVYRYHLRPLDVQTVIRADTHSNSYILGHDDLHIESSFRISVIERYLADSLQMENQRLIGIF